MVNINTSVPGASVVLDGKEVGTTPITGLKVKNSTNSNRIIIQKEGYATVQRTLAKETKTANAVAVGVGYFLCWLVVPMLLWINAAWIEGPVPDQYFVLTGES
jgi:hypothetical protein